MIATGLHLCLFIATMAFHRPPWTLPTPEQQASARTENLEGEQVVFSPTPEPQAGWLLKADMVLAAPAIWLGFIPLIGAILLNVFPHGGGEAAIIGFAAPFVVLVWYGIGNWTDRVLGKPTVQQAPSVGMLRVRQILLRALAWLTLAFLGLGVLEEYRRTSKDTIFVFAVLGLWAGLYLACTWWGDRRLQRRHC